MPRRFPSSSTGSGSCCTAGVDSAQPLFSRTKIAGTFHSWARFSDSWNVPAFVAPSPKNATATRFSPRIWKARAAPTIAGNPPRRRRSHRDSRPRGRRGASSRRSHHCNPRPSRELGHDPVDRRSLRDRVPVRAVSTMTSSRSSAEHTRRRRFLPDRDVEEPRELAGAEALLDLLFEAADEEHLAEEAAQHLLGHSPASGPGLLLDSRHRAAIMLIRRCGLPISGRGWRSSSGPTGTTRTSRSPRGLDRRCGCHPRAARARTVGRELRFHVTRDGSSRERLRNLLSRLDSKRVWGTLLRSSRRNRCPRAGGPTPRRTSLVKPGTTPSPGLLRAGATSCASSSSTRRPSAESGSPRRPMNPTRNPEAIALRFRVSGKQGYGVPPGWPGGASSGWTQTGSRGGSRSWASSPTRRTPIRRAPSGGWPDAPSRSISPQRTIFADPFMPPRACGSQRKRRVPVFLSFTFQV